jgi:hypothetical protein
MTADYDTSAPGGFYWGELPDPPPWLDMSAASGFSAFDQAAQDERAAEARQIATSRVRCCEAGKVAYPEACPWHPYGGEPERVRRRNLRKRYR